jgi:hypothetical protein
LAGHLRKANAPAFRVSFRAQFQSRDSVFLTWVLWHPG